LAGDGAGFGWFAAAGAERIKGGRAIRQSPPRREPSPSGSAAKGKQPLARLFDMQRDEEAPVDGGRAQVQQV
jgi:hypothetical protein